MLGVRVAELEIERDAAAWIPGRFLEGQRVEAKSQGGVPHCDCSAERYVPNGCCAHQMRCI